MTGKGYIAALATTVIAYRSLHSLARSSDETKALIAAFKGVSLMVGTPFILLPLETLLASIGLTL